MSTSANPNPETQEPKKSFKKWPLYVVIAVLLIAAGLILCYWLIIGKHYISTNDAYVDGNIIEVFPRAEGSVQMITVNDTDFVEEGQLLAQIDPTDYQLQFDESKTNLAMALRNTQQMFNQVGELNAALNQQKIYLEQAQNHLFNREALVGIGGVSKESYEDAQSALYAAQAEMVRIQEELKKAEAQTYNTTPTTHPLVINAIEKVKQAWLNLQNTKILAPCDGFIAQKKVQVGETAGASQSLLSIVPLDNLWVTANFKEMQLSKIRIGQTVKVKTDLYKNQYVFDGIVLGIAPGTGSVFSIIPPQNATGNWIKIVQRVPVRIGLKRKAVQRYPLRVGLSTTVTIDVTHQHGKILSKMQPQIGLYQTEIYNDQLSGVEPIIQTIIQENLNVCSGS